MEAEVLYEYVKTQEDELSLEVGQIIQNVKQVDVGWCEGEVNGQSGMFPDNFVKLRPATQAAPANPSTVSLRNGESEKKIRRAKIIFSYVAQCEDELSLDVGQLVDILDEDEEGWFRGRVGKNEGVFPSNFVEEVAEGASSAATPAPKPSSPEPAPPEIPAVDSQTGERQPPADGKPGVRGPNLMAGFDPSKARAQLKNTSKTNVAAPPLEKPPEHKKPPPPATPAAASTGKRRGKVMYDYDAENEDELTVKMGDVLEILKVEPEGQEGWVEAKLNGKIGLIADVFFEMLPDAPPPAQPAQPVQLPEKPAPPTAKDPPGKQMVPPPSKNKEHPPPKKPEPKKPPMIPSKMETTTTTDGGDPAADFPVPKTTPLDTSAVRDRPKTKNRPPSSRSNLHAEDESPPVPPASDEGTDESTKNLPPWRLELIKKKQQQPKLAPKPAGKPKPAGSISKPEPPPMARSRLNTGGSKSEVNPATAPPTKPTVPKPAAAYKPKPVENKFSPAPQESSAVPHPSVASNTPSAAPPSSSSSSTSPATSATAAAAASPPVDNSWKEAFDKLQGEFSGFKSKVMDLVNTLTDDLDKERKIRASLEIDIDRIKKAQRSLVN